MRTDRYADWDAAYVLGALSSVDRREYEAHLAECPACRDAVAELAGMPGLLAGVEPVEVLALDVVDLPPLDPGGGLPSGLASGLASGPPSRFEVIRSAESAPEYLNPGRGVARRRRRWLAVAAALVALGGAAGGGYAISEAQHVPAQTISGPTRLAFSPVTPSSMTAVVDVTPVGDRTTIAVECQYGGQGQGASGWTDYSVWAVQRDGRAGLVTTFRAYPDRVMRPTGTAGIPVSQLASVEIRSVDSGKTIMRATVS